MGRAVDACWGCVHSEPATDPLIGEVIASRYRVEAHVGDGSMGSVYRARHVKVGRPFALKVMRPSLTGDPGLRRRFLREAELAGGLHHPGIVAMVDLGETSTGLCYLVMEYAAGDTLYDLIMRSAPLPAARVVSIVRQLCDGLAHAHDHGLIHRDLKPENVVVEADPRGGDRMKIIDFGIAILRDEAVSTSPERLTTAGLVLGTPHYMAPEQATGDAIDHRVDLFALGVMCFEMLTGRAPFDGDGVEVAHANVSIDTPAMRERAPELVIDPLLEAFTRRLMSKSREARPSSAAAARALLDLIELDRTAAAAMLEVPLAAADTRNVLWAPRQPVAIAAAAMDTAVPVPLDPQDERTELTRAVAPRRAPVAAASAIAVLAVVMVIVVAIAAQRQREPEVPAAKHAPIPAARVTSHASPALMVVAHVPQAAATNDRIADPAAVAVSEHTAATAVGGHGAAMEPARVEGAGIDQGATGRPAIAVAGPAAVTAGAAANLGPARVAGHSPAGRATSSARTGVAAPRDAADADAARAANRGADDPAAAPPVRPVAENAEIAAAVPDAGESAAPATASVPASAPPSAPPPVAVATQPTASAPRAGALPPPTAPPASADPAGVAQLYAAIGQELRALDKRPGAAADLWPAYLRIRINEAMADRAMREEVDAQLHRLHAQIVKRGDVHCETPPH